MPSVRCRDVGFDCDFEADAETKEELMRKISAHAKEVHSIQTVHPIIQAKVRKATRD